jgi:hypothetical protein
MEARKKRVAQRELRIRAGETLSFLKPTANALWK